MTPTPSSVSSSEEGRQRPPAEWPVPVEVGGDACRDGASSPLSAPPESGDAGSDVSGETSGPVVVDQVERDARRLAALVIAGRRPQADVVEPAKRERFWRYAADGLLCKADWLWTAWAETTNAAIPVSSAVQCRVVALVADAASRDGARLGNTKWGRPERKPEARP